MTVQEAIEYTGWRLSKCDGIDGWEFRLTGYPQDQFAVVVSEVSYDAICRRVNELGTQMKTNATQSVEGAIEYALSFILMEQLRPYCDISAKLKNHGSARRSLEYTVSETANTILGRYNATHNSEGYKRIARAIESEIDAMLLENLEMAKHECKRSN